MTEKTFGVGRILNGFKNATFPKWCISCSSLVQTQDSLALCQQCLNDIRYRPDNICAVCGGPLQFDYEIQTIEEYACGHCRKDPPPFSASRYAFAYDDPIREVIHKFKFSSQPSLARPLARLGEDHLVPWLAANKGAVIIPVPLSVQRLRQRGYNHSFLLARELGLMAGLEVAEGVLRRIRNTTPQYGLSREKRLKNVKGAFALLNGESLEGRKVIVFDDIHTTGATIEEVCRTMAKSKPDDIMVATLCRTAPD
jgi:ComF family protein